MRELLGTFKGLKVKIFSLNFSPLSHYSFASWVNVFPEALVTNAAHVWMSPRVPWVPSQGCSPRCGSHTALGQGLFPAHLDYNHKLIGMCVVLSSQFFTVYSLGIFRKAQIIALWLLFRVSCLAVSDSAFPQIPLFCLQLPHQAVCSCECTQLGQQEEKKITKIIYLFKNTDLQVG